MINKDIAESIIEHEKSIKDQNLLKFFQENPEIVERYREEDKVATIEFLKELNSKIQLLDPYIRETKDFLKEGITERTVYSACFLLYHKIIQTWEGLGLLIVNGNYQESMELLRSIQENIDLINLFILDQDPKHLTDWFSGEIITNGISRASFQNALNESGVLPKKVKAADLKNNNYKIFSNYTHAGYGAMLESVDVFRKDFDLTKTCGFHRLREAKTNIENVIVSLRISLMSYYLIIIKDKIKTDELVALDKGPQRSPKEIVDYIEGRYGEV